MRCYKDMLDQQLNALRKIKSMNDITLSLDPLREGVAVDVIKSDMTSIHNIIFDSLSDDDVAVNFMINGVPFWSNTDDFKTSLAFGILLSQINNTIKEELVSPLINQILKDDFTDYDDRPDEDDISELDFHKKRHEEIKMLKSRLGFK